jgi:hypothetical protein
MKYLSWFTAAAAAGLLTLRGFRVDHWNSAFTSASFPDKEVTPYLFGAAGLAIVVLFGYSVICSLRAERLALQAADGANDWGQLCAQVAGPSAHGRCGEFCTWAQRQLALNPGTAPDSQGWLGRQLAASQHGSSIRTLANVLIVLGIAFTFEAIAKSTAALSGAVKHAAESGAPANAGPARSGDAKPDGNVEHLVAQANTLRSEIGKALDPLTVAFGANLNGILFTIDLLVLLAFLRLLDGDATRQLQRFVLDLADPLLQAAAVKGDPTHELLRELNENQVRELDVLVQRLQQGFSDEVLKAIKETAGEAKVIGDRLQQIAGKSGDIAKSAEMACASIAETANKAVETTATRTARALTKQVSEEFATGLSEFKRVVTVDLPQEFSSAGNVMASAVRSAAVNSVEEAHQASRKSLQEAGTVGDRLQTAAESLAHALDRAIAGLAAHTESAAQHLADAGQLSGAALASACQGGAKEVREAAQSSADLLRESGAQAQASVAQAAAKARAEFGAERIRQAKSLGEETQRLTDATAALQGVTEHFAVFASRQTDLTASQANLAVTLTEAAAGLERSGQATALATAPLLKSAERIAVALDRDGRNLAALHQELAKQPGQLAEAQSRLGNVLTALATAERAMTAATAQTSVTLQNATDALRAATAPSLARPSAEVDLMAPFQQQRPQWAPTVAPVPSIRVPLPFGGPADGAGEDRR